MITKWIEEIKIELIIQIVKLQTQDQQLPTVSVTINQSTDFRENPIPSQLIPYIILNPRKTQTPRIVTLPPPIIKAEPSFFLKKQQKK